MGWRCKHKGGIEVISNAKTEVFAWRLPRAGTCGVPEADVFFAAFDNMCEVLEQSVAVNKKMGISLFRILDFKEHLRSSPP